MSGGIHGEHPFAPPPESREPVRRLRGRLAAPTTILTAGEAPQWVGITVSSILVAEGEPGLVAALVGDLTEFFEEADERGSFLVHVLGRGRRELADRFAGLRPAPGGPFSGRPVEQTAWGPRLTDIPDWAGCRVRTADELGYQRLLVGEIETLELSELTDPLVYFRGRYRGLS